MSPKRKRTTRRILIILVLLAVPSLFALKGCRSPLPNRDPTGEVFPTVLGESLEKEPTEIPAAFAGKPAVLLVGYEQSAQFDIDRWLMGLIQAETGGRIVEVPTIPGLVPTIISGWIDDGMRSGIPEQDWGAVVTLYGDAAKPVARLTGTEKGQLARVLVLDASGKIVWFYDGGYAAREAIAVAELVRDLSGS